MDAERQRLHEIRAVHGGLWRTLVELKHHQRDYAALNLPSLADARNAERQAVNDYLGHLATLVRMPDQVDRVQKMKVEIADWYARWDRAIEQSGSPEVLLTFSENDYTELNRLMVEFDRRQLEIWDDSNRVLFQRRELFFSILAAIA